MRRPSIILLPALLLLATATLSHAQTKTYTGAELIAGVKAAKPSGSIYARIRLEHSAASGASTTLQVQVKRRPTEGDGSESLYQVIFPKERKGESLLLKVQGGRFTGSTFEPGRGVQPLKAGSVDAPLFGTALSIEDLVGSFLKWPSHQITGQEKVGNAACTIVESRPSGGKSGPFVRTWIDDTRFAPMRAEIHGANGKLEKTVLTEKVMRGSKGYYAPVIFTVTDTTTGAVTRVEGVRSDDDVMYTDADFSEAALQQVSGAPKGS